MTKYTFQINGTDFSDIVSKYGYDTDLMPVKTNTLTTMDGVDHFRVLRYKGRLNVTLNPQTALDRARIYGALQSQPLTVTYHCFQRGGDVAVKMSLDNMPAVLGLINGSRTLLDQVTLSFTEL